MEGYEQKHSCCYRMSIGLCILTFAIQLGFCIYGNCAEKQLTEPYDKFIDKQNDELDSTIKSSGDPFEDFLPYIDGLAENGKKAWGIASKGIVFVLISVFSWVADGLLYLYTNHTEESIDSEADERIFKIASGITAVIPIVFGIIDYCSWTQFF